MATTNTASSLSALFQEVYLKSGMLDHRPDGAMLLRQVKFTGQETTTGGKVVVPVILTRENGFTYRKSDEDTAWALEDSNRATIKRVEIIGTNMVLRSSINYEAAARAMKGKATFADGTELMIENMKESMEYRLEMQLLGGQTGVGTVGTATSTTVLKVDVATWAPAVWAGIEGAKVEVFDATLATLRGTASIVSVNMDPDDSAYRSVTLDTALTAPAAGDVIFFKSAFSVTDGYQEFAGLRKILNTQTGNLFNVPTTYPLWRPSRFNVNGALTITKILNALTRLVSKGLRENVTVIVSPATWQSLVNPVVDPKDTSGARKIDSSYNEKKMTFGTEGIVIKGQNGTAEIVSHLFCGEGEAFIVPMKRLRRVGATDVTFNTPGNGTEFFIQMQNNAGYELRCYANQALLFDAPAKGAYLYGITN